MCENVGIQRFMNAVKSLHLKKECCFGGFLWCGCICRGGGKEEEQWYFEALFHGTLGLFSAQVYSEIF